MTKAFARLRVAALAGAFALGTAAVAQAETVFHRGNGAEPETLDPHKSTGVTEANIIYDMMEGLLIFSPDGQPVPGAAEKWDISDDGKVYTFHLRANAKWSNGDPVTSEDFVYSLRRAVDPVTASDYAPILAPILNAEDIIASKTPVDKLGVEAVDPQTLKITLKAPTPYFLGLLVHHISWPVHKATVEKFGEEWTRPGNSVTNGPYTITEWVPQSKIVLTKNPNFHDAANVKIDTVVHYPTEDINEEFKRFQAGELDMTYTIPTDQIKWAAANMPNEYKNGPYFGTYYYVVNLTKEPIGTDVRLRKALALAIDRDILTEKITQGGEVPAYAWVPPGVPGYDAQRVDFAPQGPSKPTVAAPQVANEKLLELTAQIAAGYLSNHEVAQSEIPGVLKTIYDAVAALASGPTTEAAGSDSVVISQADREAMAKQLYAEAGYGEANPLKVEILYNTSERHQKIAVAIASMWKKVLGVEATMTNQEWKVYLDSRDQKNFQVARAAWIGDYMDASNFLDLFLSNAGERNDAGYNNPKFDELMAAAAVNPDPTARQDQLEEAERVFLADLPLIPIYHYRDVKMVSTKIHGYVDNVMGFHLTRYLSKE